MGPFTSGITLGLVLLFVALLVIDHFLRPRCPSCRSRNTVQQGEWDGVAFHHCVRTEHNWDKWY